MGNSCSVNAAASQVEVPAATKQQGSTGADHPPGTAEVVAKPQAAEKQSPNAAAEAPSSDAAAEPPTAAVGKPTDGSCKPAAEPAAAETQPSAATIKRVTSTPKRVTLETDVGSESRPQEGRKMPKTPAAIKSGVKFDDELDEDEPAAGEAVAPEVAVAAVAAMAVQAAAAQPEDNVRTKSSSVKFVEAPPVAHTLLQSDKVPEEPLSLQPPKEADEEQPSMLSPNCRASTANFSVVSNLTGSEKSFITVHTDGGHDAAASALNDEVSESAMQEPAGCPEGVTKRTQDDVSVLQTDEGGSVEAPDATSDAAAAAAAAAAAEKANAGGVPGHAAEHAQAAAAGEATAEAQT